MIVQGICNRCQHHLSLVQEIPTRHQHLYKETPDMNPEVYHYPNPLLIIPQVHTRVWHKLQIVFPPPHKRCQQQTLLLTSGRDQELNTLHERLQLDIKNYKDTIATQSRIAFEGAKKELSTHYQQQMNQQEINHSQSVNTLKQQINDLATQLNHQQAATQQFNHTQPHSTMPLDKSFPPPPQTIDNW